jgi:hypothetical protein
MISFRQHCANPKTLSSQHALLQHYVQRALLAVVLDSTFIAYRSSISNISSLGNKSTSTLSRDGGVHVPRGRSL